MTHTADLVERHRITIPVGATGDNVAVARLHAEAYARARGFEIPAGSFQVLQQRGKLPTVGNQVGVAFDVVVGRGDIALDQRQPGVLDTWTWSAGMTEWWRRWLPGGRQGRVIARPRDGIASVTALGNPNREVGQPYPQPEPQGHGIDAPTIHKGEWLGPDALKGGPVPGGGPQHGTGELPPWLRRGTDEDPDA